MKKIKLRWNGLGYCDKYQAEVFLYTEKNKLVFYGKTKKGECNISLQPERIYKIFAISKGECFQKVLYIDSCHKVYTFSFPRAIQKKSQMNTFHLTDFYYSNLPIEKGEIIFA